MPTKKRLPKELLVRWNEDQDEAYLELAEAVNDVCISPGEEVTVGVYVLSRTTKVRCKMEMD